MTATQSEGTNGSSDVDQKEERTPLPKLQLSIVYLVQFTEPLTATVIYPFVNELVRATGITGGNEAKTGYYAGIIQSIFFLTETCTVFAWGRLSDVLGRRPVLLMGPLGLALSMLGFGLSKTYWPLVYFRALQGVFNGNIGVSKSVIGEITDPTNIGDAFALTPLMWSTGSTLGSIVGGVLSDPAARWPETFGKFAFIHEYPYMLPTAAAAIVSFLAFLISCIGLKETLHPSKKINLSKSLNRVVRKLRPSKDESTTPLLDDNEPIGYGVIPALEQQVPDSTEEVPPLSDLFVRPFLITILNYGAFAFLDMSIAALLPLTFSTPIQYGGLGMDPFKIGLILGAFGVIRGFVALLFVGKIVRKYGPTTIFQNSISAFFLTFLAFPVQNYFARRANGIDVYVIAAILVQFSTLTMIAANYASMSILVLRNTPSKHLLGAANGAAQMATSGGRALAPAIASSLFSASIQHNLANGYAVYYLFLVFVAGLVWASRYLPPPRVPV